MKRAAAARLLRRFVWCCALGAVISAGVTAAAWWDGAVRGRVSAWRVIEDAVEGPMAVARGRWGVFEMRRYWSGMERPTRISILERPPFEDLRAPDSKIRPPGANPPSFLVGNILADALRERIDHAGPRAFADGGSQDFHTYRGADQERFVRIAMQQGAKHSAVEFWTAGLPFGCMQQACVIHSYYETIVPVTDVRVTLLRGPSFVVSPGNAQVVRIFPLALLGNAVAAGAVLCVGWSAFAAAQRARRRWKGRCGACGYEVAGAGGVCPECGTGIAV